MTDYNLKDLLQDYKGSTSYICDAISEQADSNVDIYYTDLFEWAKHNFYAIEEANKELGTPDSIIAQIQQAQFLENELALYDLFNDEDDRVEAVEHVYRDELATLTNAQREEFIEFIKDEFDNNSRINDIDDKIEELREEGE